MSAHPIFEHMFAQMASRGLLPPASNAAPIDLKAERIRRERAASERRHAERHSEPRGAA